jgi:glycosyltransferase involved in cell wall biosynthesis
MKYEYSFIIPVYNRPREIEELLESFTQVIDIVCCEIVIIEDGSEKPCEGIVKHFQDKLNISYYYKTNSGPGASRNYGMKRAQSDYFIILDSDVLIPKDYIINLKHNLKQNFVDCFGGPDMAHDSFSYAQKAINYSMTSFWTTGGIRGHEQQKKNFQPRSFNMGLSKNAFVKSTGFSSIHPGEDPDLVLRLKKLNFQTILFINCSVYHKRRVSWNTFSTQMYKFGLVRPILNLWHPESHKLIYYFPTFFTIGMALAFLLLLIGFNWLFILYMLYFAIIFLEAYVKEKNFKIAFFSIYAVFVQFFSYGIAFFESTVNIHLLNKIPEKIYPKLFFKN